jgi:hypothetical protein
VPCYDALGVFAFMRYPPHTFFIPMALTATVVDSVCIYLFAARRRALA